MPVSRNRPLLSKYPRLHMLLKNDTAANIEFNAAIADVAKTNIPGTVEKDLTEQLVQSENNLQEYIEKYKLMEKLTEATVRFIRLLGETIEEQTKLTPYTDDLLIAKEYTVHFTAAQIRLALHLHWDVIGQALENEILRTVIIDPAADRAKYKS